MQSTKLVLITIYMHFPHNNLCNGLDYLLQGKFLVLILTTLYLDQLAKSTNSLTSGPQGVRILAPVRHHVETGPGLEASGGRRLTSRCLSTGGGSPRGSALAVADGSHAFVRVAVRSLTVPRGS